MKKNLKIFTIIILAIIFLAYLIQNNLVSNNNQSEWDKNNTRDIQSNDKLLNKSKKITEQKLPFFISEFKNKNKSEYDFFTKIELTEGEYTEHIWIWILSLNDENSIGLLSNEPKFFKKIKYLDTITFDINKAEDLTIMKNDSVVFGGFLQAEIENQ